ncbi:MAG: hypothetical protein KDB53_05250 [Planctomycetes bacterium]|nr:hypothetical protein [Planctomycetota bacterium]
MPIAFFQARRMTLLCLFLVLIGPPIVVAQGGHLFLVVDNPTALSRQGELCVSGIPIPSSVQVLAPEPFHLVDENGGIVPAQFRALSRWNGLRNDRTKPCKFVLAAFPVDVEASGSRMFEVRPGAGPDGAILINESNQDIVISTGVADFQISTSQAGLVEQVSFGSQSCLTSSIQLDLRGPGGTVALVQPIETVIEEPGTVRCVVRKRLVAPALGLEFTIRLYFTTGSPEVTIDLRVENPGCYGEIPTMGPTPQTAWFDRLGITVPLAGGVQDVIAQDGVRSLANGSWRLDQDFQNPANQLDMVSGFQWTEKQSGMTLATGNRHSGAVAASGPFGSVLGSMDRFWQNYPGALAVTPQGLSLTPFPSFGNGPTFGGMYSTPTNPGQIDPSSLASFRFEGGRWKTTRMHLRFALPSSPTPAPADLAAFSERRSAPLMARPGDLAWSFKELNFGQLVVERQNWADPGAQRYERILEVMVNDQAADDQPSLGRIGMPKFRERGGTYGGGQFYGWQNFGDLVWGDGYASLHYDLPFGVLINWYRTGDYRFVDIGRDLAEHRRDYDQYHSKHPNDAARGGQFYEKGWFHGNFSAPTPSHTWVHGLLLWYVMTGDEGAREAAIEVGEFVTRRHPENWDGWWGSRILGWQLEALGDLYNYLGDVSYLNLAQQVAQRWETLEQADGGQGYVINQGYASNPHAQTWMQMIVFNALAKYYFLSADPAVLPVMGRMADWYLNDCIQTDPTGPVTARPVGKLWGRWAPGGYAAEPSVHHCWVASEALANAAVILWRTDCFQQARRLWDSLARYHQVPSADTTLHDFSNPESFSDIAFRMLQFPNSESKIYGNIAHWGHAYLSLSRFNPNP